MLECALDAGQRGPTSVARRHVAQAAADAGDGRATFVGQLLHHEIALGIVLEEARDVFQGQHVAADRRRRHLDRCHTLPCRITRDRPGLRRDDRRHLDADQMAGTGSGDEMRQQLAALALEAVLQRFQRMCNESMIEHGVDRAAETDQRACSLGVGHQVSRLQPCAVVVEDDAAVEVADDHRLRQVGHQRGQPVLLAFDRGLGLPHPRLDVAEQVVALLRQFIGRRRQLAHLGRSLGLDAEAAVGAVHQPQLFTNVEQALHVLAEQFAQQLQSEDEGDQRDHAPDRQPAVHRLEEARALRLGEIAIHDARGQQEGRRHQQAEDDDGKNEAVACVHGSILEWWQRKRAPQRPSSYAGNSPETQAFCLS